MKRPQYNTRQVEIPDATITPGDAKLFSDKFDEWLKRRGYKEDTNIKLSFGGRNIIQGEG